jgi:Uma2 family endonuclease
MSTILAPPLELSSASPAESGAREEALCEVINGQRVELPPMSAFAARIASRLFRRLTIFLEANDLGELVAEVLFHLPLAIDRNRRPDVAFVSYQRSPKEQPSQEDDNAWDVVPDLAVEVISPNDLAEDLLVRIEEYLRGGVRLVWVVYPKRQLVHAYESLTQIRGLTRADELDGGQVLPGFRLPLATLFPQEQAGSE